MIHAHTGVEKSKKPLCEDIIKEESKIYGKNKGGSQARLSG